MKIVRLVGILFSGVGVIASLAALLTADDHILSLGILGASIGVLCLTIANNN